MTRRAKHKHPQLVCVLADNSGSMAGSKAEAATAGIREMLLRCQTMGPRGHDRSCYEFILIRFGSEAEVDPVCNGVPVRSIDTDSIYIYGDGGGTNITQALEVAHCGLVRYLQERVEPHPQRNEHPLPLVLLFSDGYNGYGKPEGIAKQIKQLNVDGHPITIACAGVSTESDDQPDERLLSAIASNQDCYLHIDNASMLTAFLAEAGSSGASSPEEVAQVIRQITDRRGRED